MISIIMPVYNGERFVAEAIDSILAQSVRDWELIVVNDGSTDGTQVVLERYAVDPRIRLIRQENGGVSSARNAGIVAARGEYLAFLDADDTWYPDCLETYQRMAKAYPKAVLLGAANDIRLQNGAMTDTAGYFADKPETLCLEDFFEAYAQDKRAKCYNMLSTCMRADAVRRAEGFRVGCRIGEDLALSLRVSAYGPVALTAHKASLYNKLNSTASRDVSFDPDWYFFDEVQTLLRDESIPARKRENLRRVMAWFQMRRARHYLIDGRRSEARAAYRAIGDDPALAADKRITRLLMLLPTWAVRRIFLLRWRSQA
ncbi:MAG: glycosyltransferase family 2 protein [Candidatus Ventricola sp.]